MVNTNFSFFIHIFWVLMGLLFIYFLYLFLFINLPISLQLGFVLAETEVFEQLLPMYKAELVDVSVSYWGIVSMLLGFIGIYLRIMIWGF